MTKDEKLFAVNEKWSKARSSLLKSLSKKAVFGDGPSNADVVFIGEAPGKKEDELGKPFVGASGKLLSEMLLEIGYKREDVYITNIVKYRPPNNRDPKPTEIKECSNWLYEELNFIKPKLIVFLGRHALRNFFPELKISDVHGKPLKNRIEQIDTKYFLPLYHPAVALYDRSMKDALKKDFRNIKKILVKLNKNT